MLKFKQEIVNASKYCYVARDTAIADGNLSAWNATNKIVGDCGKNIDSTTYGFGEVLSWLYPDQVLALTDDVSTVLPAHIINAETVKIICLPANVRTIRDGTFTNCSNLANFVVASNNKDFIAIDGSLYELEDID